MVRATVALLLVPALALAAPVPKGLRKVTDHAAIVGVWEMVSADEGDGAGCAPDPSGRVIRYTFTADGTVTIATLGGQSNEFDYTLDPTATPKAIDFRGEVVTSLDLYEIDGDTLRTCAPKSPTSRRPAEFKAGHKTACVITFKRMTDAEK